MNHEAAIAIAHGRMRELGKTADDYHIETARVTGNNIQIESGLIEIPAYNQIYFLINSANYFGFQIVAEVAYFNADDYTQNTGEEFTGLIRIQRIATKWNLLSGSTLPPKTNFIEFIRVIIH